MSRLAGTAASRGGGLRRACMASLCLGGAYLPATAAHAQVTTGIILTPQIPSYMVPYQDRSVSESGEGDWKAQGVQVGGFNVKPELALRQNLTNNAYQTANKTAAAYESVDVDVRAQSQWSSHELNLEAYHSSDYYVGHRDRNVSEWALKADGTIDVTSADQITASADLNRVVFNALSSGDVFGSDAIVALRYGHVAIGASRTFGAGLFTVQAERYHVDFLSTTGVSQAYNNHDYNRISALGQYSFTPSLTAYAQFNYVTTDYGAAADVNTNSLNSQGYRMIAGARVDVPGLGRASVAMAYSNRTYDKAGVANVGGLSAQARAELFVSPLTTVTGEVGSRIVDALLIATPASRERYVSARVDHALLRNLKLRLDSRVNWQKAIFGGDSSRYESAAFSARYLASRRFVIEGNVSYTSRVYTSNNARPSVSELSGGLSLTYRI